MLRSVVGLIDGFSAMFNDDSDDPWWHSDRETYYDEGEQGTIELNDAPPQLLQNWYWYYIHNQMIDYEIVAPHPTWFKRIKAAIRRRKQKW